MEAFTNWKYEGNMSIAHATDTTFWGQTLERAPAHTFQVDFLVCDVLSQSAEMMFTMGFNSVTVEILTQFSKSQAWVFQSVKACCVQDLMIIIIHREVRIPSGHSATDLVIWNSTPIRL